MLGLLNVYKRSGDTSAFVVNRIKKLLGVKCGHMGTLDPLASGVLPVAIGQASRLFDYLLDKEKTYVATFDFSYTTPSLDLETAPSEYSDRVVTQEEIEKILPRFIGEIAQIPPDYSAKCVDGVKAYKLARRGRDLDLKAKTVFIKSIKIIDKISDYQYNYEIICKGGTYIRSLCRDIAEALGVKGVMTKLERTKSGVFTAENALTLADIEACEDRSKLLIAPENVVDFEKLYLNDEDALHILNGLCDDYPFEDGVYRAYSKDEFCGIMKVESGKVKMTYIRDL